MIKIPAGAQVWIPPSSLCTRALAVLLRYCDDGRVEIGINI